MRAAENCPGAQPWIEIPLAGNFKEYTMIKDVVVDTCDQFSSDVNYKVGSMIEIPRMCVTADQIAPHVDFLSFGTNDLTQFTMGISRDDAATFLELFVDEGIYERDPFQSIDREGVGMLM